LLCWQASVWGFLNFWVPLMDTNVMDFFYGGDVAAAAAQASAAASTLFRTAA